MTLLTREAILAADDLKTETISVPEWGGSVLVRTMTGVDRDAYEQSMVVADADGNRKADMRNMRAKLVAMTMVGEDGGRLFSVDEVALLGGKSAAALDRVFEAAQRLNGLAAADVEDATKNSVAGPSAGSTSA